jgi:hypothetical protein
MTFPRHPHASVLCHVQFFGFWVCVHRPQTSRPHQLTGLMLVAFSWSLMTCERSLWYPRYSPEILASVLLAVLLACSFQRSVRSEVTPGNFTFLELGNRNSDRRLSERPVKGIAVVLSRLTVSPFCTLCVPLAVISGYEFGVIIGCAQHRVWSLQSVRHVCQKQHRAKNTTFRGTRQDMLYCRIWR